MTHYQIHNYAEGNEYINIDSDITDINEIWTTWVPYNFTPSDDDKPTKPFQFAKRSEAVIILDQIKNSRLADWNKYESQYKIMGKKKPAWKIYKIEE